MATIKDVARLAGVSVATVSRVYNDSDLVRDDTRELVQLVAQQLGYSPHGAARSLITSRTHTLGVLLPDLYGEFFSEVIRGIDQRAQQEGYHVLVSSAREGGQPLEAALRSMRGRVDGLIVMSPDMNAGASRRGLPERFPVVLLNCPPTDTGYESVEHCLHTAGVTGAIPVPPTSKANTKPASRLKAPRVFCCLVLAAGGR